jgi:hypothetical protein
LSFPSISAVPLYAGLRCFSEGRDFEQWTGDDSKSLMKVAPNAFRTDYDSDMYCKQVYIAAIAGHVPSKMVQCMSTFMDLCYIFRRSVITNTALKTAEALLERFHELRLIFVTEGSHSSISLPSQHALPHYLTSIPLFGSPNGLCSSITESKHIKAVRPVKEPWRRSSRFKALVQMLRSIIRLEKLAALRRRFLQEGMLIGSTAAHFARLGGQLEGDGSASDGDDEGMVWSNEDGLGVNGDMTPSQETEETRRQGVEGIDDAGPESGPQSLSSITIAATPGMSLKFVPRYDLF